jgi:hypothetical protein
MPGNANSVERLSGPIFASSAQNQVDGVVDLGDVAGSQQPTTGSQQPTDGFGSATAGVYEAGDEGSLPTTSEASKIARRSRSHPMDEKSRNS